ncbi:MAG: hypothetical protein DI629_11195 [Mesorhizobium amorphae]|nr:MAG: hypothetical protein DI629_11195 [Mesorhizobium amorphae]
MYRLSCFALIALGVIHLTALGADAVGYAPGWLHGDLWTFDHWASVADQQPALVFSGFAFWSTFGSVAPGLIAVGYLLLWIDDRGLPPPRAAIVGIIAWALIGTLLMPPSGLPAILLVSLGLLRKGRRPAAIET